MLVRTETMAIEADQQTTSIRGARSAFHAKGGARAAGAVGGKMKRAFDVVLAGSGLLMLAPLMLMIAAAVRLSDRGPVLYGHERIGHGGRRFRCWKFRSMVTDGDAALSAYLAENADARREWERDRKLRHDPRVTALGRVLRAYSLDELPQLWNVLKGEMSLVGPRPVVESELQLYGAEQTAYLRARPGITGLWQVSGRNDVSYETRVAFDRAYVERWSVMTDCAIILRTIPAAVAARGSY